MLLKKKSSSFLTWDPRVHKVPRYFLFLANCSDNLNVSSINTFPWAHSPSSHDLMLCIPERVPVTFFYGIQIVVYSVYGYDTNLEIWSDLGYELSLCLQVSDEVSSSLSCIGTEIYKSCYFFIPLLQSLVKILENLLWWLTWGLVLLHAGLGNETGLKNPIHCELLIFIQQMCQHRVLWPCSWVHLGKKFTLFRPFCFSQFLLQQCSTSSYLQMAVPARAVLLAWDSGLPTFTLLAKMV